MTQTALLGDICIQITDGTHNTVEDSKNGDYYLLSAKNIKNRIVITNNERRIDEQTLTNLRKRTNTAKGDVLLTSVGTIGETAIIKEDNPDYEFQRSVLIFKPDTTKVIPEYLYYVLRSKKSHFISMATGAVQKCLFIGPVKNELIQLPDLEMQKKIAAILGALDEKIELNRKMNETLEQMGQALFRHYFIDNPDAEKWKDGVLGDIIVNFDSKRKPLSSRQREEMKGEYRYFGATSVMDYVNDYLFDGKYLLLAEDGSVIKNDGTPYLQYIWGKFWVNNHAHILQAKEPYTVEYLYLLLAQANVQSLVSGAVQLKINQKAMNSFKIKLPPDELVTEFCKKVNPLFDQRRKNEEEIQTLTTLRDTLLPRLISGKVKV